MIDYIEVFAKISKYTGLDQIKGGLGFKVDGASICPTISLEDAMKLAAVMGIGIKYYNAYKAVSATHSIILHEVVESYDNISSMPNATIKAILEVAYKVTVSGKR